MDTVFLSRIQFAMTSGFHYIYPPLSIGLGLILVIIEGIYVKTGKPLYKKMAKFWTNIFALTFALGVATGLVQLFGFGTNWAQYSRFVGDVFGSALGAEGIFAFFLEAGFLGVMLFGWNRVSKKMHYLSTILVALGAHFSALWIVIANSWMQTPTGYRIVGTGTMARAQVTNFFEMAFNPSMIDRVTHVILGCWLAGAFLAISISAYYLLRKKHLAFSKATLKVSLIAAFVVLVLQGLSGDSTARGVSVNQPAKLAAMEGVYKTADYTAMNIIGWVDKKTQTVKGLKIPGLLSLFVKRNVKTPVEGLDKIPEDDWPPVQPVFQAYHLMIWMWGLMFVTTCTALIMMFRKKLPKAKWTLGALVLSVLLPQVANQMGWMTAEIGRQPWIVYGIMRTSEGVSASINASQVLGSLIMLSVIYIALLAVFLFLLNRKIQHGPEDGTENATVYHDPYAKEGTKS
ncbi:MAG: Cytochrome bd-I ubiquinol oxidase subunit 1 [Chlamydiae bacterium]|nr:Cytochrome bd-I ubiquinol oxidase subunit 1 [Chlamydiota bacterium]